MVFFLIAQWVKNLSKACKAGDTGGTDSIPGLGRTPGEGDGNPLQDFCLENPMDSGAWWATVTMYSAQISLRSPTQGFLGASVVKNLPVKQETQV